MEQIKMFFANYESIVLMIGEIVLFLLLLTAIQEIKRTQSELRNMNDRVKNYVTTLQEESLREENVETTERKISQNLFEQEMEEERQESPETLINAVIQEIFP